MKKVILLNRLKIIRHQLTLYVPFLTQVISTFLKYISSAIGTFYDFFALLLIIKKSVCVKSVISPFEVLLYTIPFLKKFWLEFFIDRFLSSEPYKSISHRDALKLDFLKTRFQTKNSANCVGIKKIFFAHKLCDYWLFKQP